MDLAGSKNPLTRVSRRFSPTAEAMHSKRIQSGFESQKRYMKNTDVAWIAGLLEVRGVKEGNVADMVRRSVGLQRLKNEIDKCDVLCANDHFRRHHNDRLLRGVEKSGISVGP
jgi:hypothetical protein